MAVVRFGRGGRKTPADIPCGCFDAWTSAEDVLAFGAHALPGDLDIPGLNSIFKRVIASSSLTAGSYTSVSKP